jgi:hypothetical protein
MNPGALYNPLLIDIQAKALDQLPIAQHKPRGEQAGG